jgi:hypothetical protein
MYAENVGQESHRVKKTTAMIGERFRFAPRRVIPATSLRVRRKHAGNNRWVSATDGTVDSTRSNAPQVVNFNESKWPVGSGCRSADIGFQDAGRLGAKLRGSDSH